MYEAKNRGRNTWCLFDDQLDPRVVERMAMENALRGAIERGELVLHYQPQVDLDTGRPVGIEALVRWNHPETGLLPPSQFIGLAEECGMINPIGRLGTGRDLPSDRGLAARGPGCPLDFGQPLGPPARARRTGRRRSPRCWPTAGWMPVAWNWN